MRVLRRCFTCILPMLAAANLASATPVQWSGNGHYYEVVSSGEIAWSAARLSAMGMEHLGHSGHLATVTSSGEQAFVQGLLSGGSQYWLGGYQDVSGVEPGGGWRWAMPESWGPYTNWDVGQPDDNGPGNPGGEEFLAMFSDESGHPVGSWNDEDDPGSPLHGAITGFIVEYDDVPAPSASPQGIALLLLLLCGAGGLLLRRRLQPR